LLQSGTLPIARTAASATAPVPPRPSTVTSTATSRTGWAGELELDPVGELRIERVSERQGLAIFGVLRRSRGRAHRLCRARHWSGRPLVLGDHRAARLRAAL